MPLFLVLGCQGGLEGNFPAQNGSGGSSSGSGGSGSGGSGSGGSGSGGSGTTACDVPNKIFKAYNCSTSGCHAGGGFDNPPNLSVANVGSALKGMNASIVCAGMKYIDPSSPKNSVIYKLMAGPDCDNERMPLGNPLEGTELTDALSCLEDWISKQ